MQVKYIKGFLTFTGTLFQWWNYVWIGVKNKDWWFPKERIASVWGGNELFWRWITYITLWWCYRNVGKAQQYITHDPRTMPIEMKPLEMIWQQGIWWPYERSTWKGESFLGEHLLQRRPKNGIFHCIEIGARQASFHIVEEKHANLCWENWCHWFQHQAPKWTATVWGICSKTVRARASCDTRFDHLTNSLRDESKDFYWLVRVFYYGRIIVIENFDIIDFLFDNKDLPCFAIVVEPVWIR